MGLLAAARDRLGDATRAFRCCDTEFAVRARGLRADAAVERGARTARELAAELNAFDESSAVARLNRDGRVESPHVARVVRRGLEYRARTDGAFDISQGHLEHGLKAYLRGDAENPPETFDAGAVSVDGDVVQAEAPIDLNGLAKGYVVDRTLEALSGFGVDGFVDGGGDMTPPPGPVGVESPYGDSTPLKVLDTDWYVATSGNYRRERGGIDHLYDPTDERLGARHELVTVVAERDCMEADALATTLAARPLDEAVGLATDWPGAAALLIHDGVFHTTPGFETHVNDN